MNYIKYLIIFAKSVLIYLVIILFIGIYYNPINK